MYSIISSKINKYLVLIIGEYLLPVKNIVKQNYQEVIKIDDDRLYIKSNFLKNCYLLQMKRRFPNCFIDYEDYIQLKIYMK